MVDLAHPSLTPLCLSSHAVAAAAVGGVGSSFCMFQDFHLDLYVHRRVPQVPHVQGLGFIGSWAVNSGEITDNVSAFTCTSAIVASSIISVTRIRASLLVRSISASSSPHLSLSASAYDHRPVYAYPISFCLIYLISITLSLQLSLRQLLHICVSVGFLWLCFHPSSLCLYLCHLCLPLTPHQISELWSRDLVVQGYVKIARGHGGCGVHCCAVYAISAAEDETPSPAKFAAAAVDRQ